VDLYGKPINFALEKGRKNPTSKCGGVMTLIFLLTLLFHGANEIYEVAQNSWTTLLETQRFEEEYKANLGDYEESFNMFVGITDESLNFLDNEFFKVSVVELDQNWNSRVSERIELRRCTDQDRDFMTKTAAGYYKNSYCFKDKSQVNLNGNWFDENFKSINI
jgi:hypothetical protein